MNEKLQKLMERNGIRSLDKPEATNAELEEAIIEIAQNQADLEDAIVELAQMITEE